MKHLSKVISIVLLALSIFACSESTDEVIKSRFEKKEGHSIERTATGMNLHITGTSTFPYTTYAFYDTIFAYNGGVLNLMEGGYIHADHYIPKMTGTGKATINIKTVYMYGAVQMARLTIKRINNLGNTDINIDAGIFRHDYLYCSTPTATINNDGVHQCQGEGMIWASGNYYDKNQTVFWKSVESNVYPYIRLNGGNFFMEDCSELVAEDVISNANSVLKGNGWVKATRYGIFNQPLSSWSTIRYCVGGWPSSSAMLAGNAVQDCNRNNCP